MKLNRKQREGLFLLLFQKGYYTKKETREQLEDDLMILYHDDADEGEETGKPETVGVTSEEDREAVMTCFEEIWPKISVLDEIIRKNLTGWTLERIGRVELAILRLMTYELCLLKNPAIGLVIDDSLDILKNYADWKAVGFVNGVIGNIVKTECTTGEQEDESIN